jgi:hypothetical protein
MRVKPSKEWKIEISSSIRVRLKASSGLLANDSAITSSIPDDELGSIKSSGGEFLIPEEKVTILISFRFTIFDLETSTNS